MRRRASPKLRAPQTNGNLEGVLVDVMGFVRRSQDFGLVDVVDAQLFENLGLCEVANTALRHDRDRHGRHDFANLFGRSHAGDATLGADLRGHALEGHDGDRPGALGDFGLLGVRDVHDDAALKHLGEAGFKAKAGGMSIAGSVAVCHGSQPFITKCGAR